MDLTRILESARSGDPSARAEIVRAAYEDLRKIAKVKMANERDGHTLSATALANELAIKLMGDSQIPVAGRPQFMAYVSKAMRHFLIDYARTRGRQKRGGDRERLTFDDALVASREQSEDLLRLHEALERFAAIDARKASVVEMRFFGGMNLEETAYSLGVSPATVKRDWDVAKAWLKRELAGEE